jgi:DNA-binding LytR/AlgR family response regulator
MQTTQQLLKSVLIMNKKLNILIVEDELLIAQILKETLNDLKYTVVEIARNYETALEILNHNKTINFIFLDINLNEPLSGTDIANKINTDFKIPFIFLTSYSDAKTIQGALVYKPQAYLIKPFTKSDLFITLELYKSRHTAPEKILEIKDGHFTVNLKHEDILWIKSENIYLEIKTTTKTYLIRNSLEKFLEKIDDENFIRIHRSYAANLQLIKAVNRVHIIVQNHKLPISRMHHEALVAKFSK